MSKQKITKTTKTAQPKQSRQAPTAPTGQPAKPAAKAAPKLKAALKAPAKAKSAPARPAAPKPVALKPAAPKPVPLRGAPARPVAVAVAPAPDKSRKAAYSKQELEHFRKIILEKKKEILEELETLRDSMMDATTGEYAYSTHMEQGTDAMEREKTFLFASREGKFLNYLEDALQRIEKGEYGKCSECGKLIEKERLEAVPHARQCLHCKMNLPK
jgi:DnaK suppressor protein